jgi:hypothetical protein
MNRYYLRVIALAIFLFVSALSGAASPRRDAYVRLDPGERIIRIVKKIKGIVRGFTSQDDSQIPPIPKP